jgi:hypothetical protein
MRSESTVPIHERALLLEGALTEEVFSKVKSGLPQEAKAEECFFSSYAFADLPVPQGFDVVFECREPSKGEIFAVCIFAVTQQFAKPLEEIPHGWKTICWLGAPARQSSLLQSLPRVSTWFEAKPSVGLCSRETWHSLCKTTGSPPAGNPDLG